MVPERQGLSVDRRVAGLQRELDGVQPGDALEAAHRHAMATLLATSRTPFARDHFVPGHFTASAFIVAPDGSRLLLIWHGKLLRWLQPGGHVEPGDVDVHAAARREVEEETGLHSADLAPEGRLLDLDIHRIPARRAEPDHLHYDVRYVFQARTLAVRAASDAQAARWVAWDDVAGLEADESVRRAVRKLR
ncbi:MAG: NUDIX domain-containing protein [Myxococcales bacterium]|nr:NUDIX domain-containing protein [Myxococcales bacterium]